MHRSLAAATRLLAVAFLACGCASTLEELPPGALELRVDCNTRVYGPHVPGRVKFWVDIINRSGGAVSPEKLRVELRVLRAGEPDAVALKQSWTYSTAGDMSLSSTGRVVIGDGNKMTIPILPERNDPNSTAPDLPLKLLPAGQYEVVAVLNDLHTSRPCPLRIERPDLKLIGRPR